MAYSITRAASALASAFHARATTAAIRDDLTTVPARLATSARRRTWQLPELWPAEHAWLNLFTAAHAHPTRPDQSPRPTGPYPSKVKKLGRPAAPHVFTPPTLADQRHNLPESSRRIRAQLPGSPRGNDRGPHLTEPS